MITSHVRKLAERRGIRNALQLSQTLGVSTRTGAKLWTDEFERIDRVTLDKLCETFGCQPGQILKHTDKSE
jgi:DNA-binding Xre family transcriptional regulator